MRFQFSFKHMEVSPTLQKYAEDKISNQIKKFVTKPIEAHVTFSVDKHRHVVHCALSGGDGFSLQVEHECGDMYGSVDQMLDKLSVQLKRKKEKLKGHKNRKNFRTVGSSSNEKGNDDSAEIDAADIIKFEQARRKASGAGA